MRRGGALAALAAGMSQALAEPSMPVPRPEDVIWAYHPALDLLEYREGGKPRAAYSLNVLKMVGFPVDPIQVRRVLPRSDTPWKSNGILV